jgi:hypothetical protein
VRRIISYGLGLALCLPGSLSAQHVIYTGSFSNRASERSQVIGSSTDFYWTVTRQKIRTKYRSTESDLPLIKSFGLYDVKLNLVRELVPPAQPGVCKQWLMTGKANLDQVMLAGSGGQTKIVCNRYYADEHRETQTRLLDSFPFPVHPSAVLLVRSADQSKILLVAFENTASEITRVHALLFDAGWNRIYHQVLSDERFSQPCIQDEEIGFPSESFDNMPIKLANNGEWLMAAPSRISRNFSLFHACANGSDFQFTEIRLSSYYKMEDIAMSVDNEKETLSLALLSGYYNSSLKNVRICNYSMKVGKPDFDTSYHFNTQLRDIRSSNLSHESFIAVPGGGYMLLKEYGYPFESKKPEIPSINPWETAYLLANYAEPGPGNRQLKTGYTLNPGLSPIPYIRNRGDLNLFYFPALSTDSTWSGIMEMEQQPESNNPDLSYLVVPAQNKLYIIYNSREGSSDPLANTTTLNHHGQVETNALIFWEMKKLLNFQKARRFSSDEIAIPYLDYQSGFAIIRL